MIKRPLVLFFVRLLLFFLLIGLFYTTLKNVRFYRRQSDTAALIFISREAPGDFQQKVPEQWREKLKWKVLKTPSLKNILHELADDMNVGPFEERESSLVKVKVSQKTMMQEPEILRVLLREFQKVDSSLPYTTTGDGALYQWLGRLLYVLYGLTVLMLAIIIWELVRLSEYLRSAYAGYKTAGINIVIVFLASLTWALINGLVFLYLSPAPFYWSVMDVIEIAAAAAFFIIITLIINLSGKTLQGGNKEIDS